MNTWLVSPLIVLAGALLVTAVAPWALTRSLDRREGTGRVRGVRGKGSGPGVPSVGGARENTGARSLKKPLALVDEAVILDIVRACILAGASILRALEVVGAGLPQRQSEPLLRATRRLRLGAAWDQAWVGAPAHAERLARCLKPAWEDGVSPVPLLEQAAQAVRARRARRAREAAAKLGVRLVLPLGLTFLPAFILVGLVPVLISTGESLFSGA